MSASVRFISAARLIAALTLGSRILGLVRECLFGYYLSTSEHLSAFRIAFMIPNLARRLFGEGALSAAAIPVLTETLQTHGEESSRRFAGTLFTVLVAVLVLAVLAAEGVIATWRGIQDDLALELAAILMPYGGLICTVAVAGGVLNVRGHFATPAAAPMILNSGIIAALLIGALGAGLSGTGLVLAVCAGVLVAGVIQIIAMSLALRAVSFFPIFGGRWSDPRVRAVASLMAPMVLGLSAVQISSLADYLIAYLFIFDDGQRVGPAVLGYAQYLYQLPLGVLGIAVATAIFPVLSQKEAAGDRAGLAETLERGVRLSFFLALPASVGLLFVARPLVATLYEHGEFGPADTQRVAGTLFFYSLGIVAYFLQHILVRAFYAMHNSRTPARIALGTVCANVILNLALVFVLQERGLALATAICAAAQVLFLSLKLRQNLPEMRWRRIRGGLGRTIVATGVMAAMLAVLATPAVLGESLGANQPVRLTVMVVAGVVAYGLTAHLFGIKDFLAEEEPPVPEDPPQTAMEQPVKSSGRRRTSPRRGSRIAGLVVLAGLAGTRIGLECSPIKDWCARQLLNRESERPKHLSPEEVERRRRESSFGEEFRDTDQEEGEGSSRKKDENAQP